MLRHDIIWQSIGIAFVTVTVEIHKKLTKYFNLIQSYITIQKSILNSTSTVLL
jgi:hypothetical protein